MAIDLGFQGFALLLIPALLFGALAGVIFWRSATHWMWLFAAAGWFVGGLLASEVVLGSETTEENYQPLIDGLLWDEALLGGLLVGSAVVLVTWLVTRHARPARQPAH
jgi:hypothetical protein